MWRLAHHRLSLGINTRHWSTSAPTCPHCDVLETYEHFLDCPITTAGLDYVSSLWTRAGQHPLPLRTLDDLLFSVLSNRRARTPRTRKNQLLRSVLVGEALYAVYTARCRSIFDPNPPPFNKHTVLPILQHRLLHLLKTHQHIKKIFSSSLVSTLLSLLPHSPTLTLQTLPNQRGSS